MNYEERAIAALRKMDDRAQEECTRQLERMAQLFPRPQGLQVVARNLAPVVPLRRAGP